MLIDIALVMIALANLLVAIALLKSRTPVAVEKPAPKVLVKPKRKLRIKDKPKELTKEDKLWHNLEVFDGTENGQLEI